MSASNGNGALPPEVAAMARVQMAGVWGGGRSAAKLPPAGQVAPLGGAARTAFFAALKIPMQNGTGKAPGAKS